MVTTSDDGTARIWRLDGRAAGQLMLDGDELILYGDDGVFEDHAPRRRIGGRGARQSSALARSATAVYNLPHQLLVRMGFGRP